MHVDFGLHLLTNWAIHVLRVVEGYGVAIGGSLEEVFYAAFDRKGLDRVGISRDTVQELRGLGRHVEKLRDPLAPIASHLDFPIEGRTCNGTAGTPSESHIFELSVGECTPRNLTSMKLLDNK